MKRIIFTVLTADAESGNLANKEARCKPMTNLFDHKKKSRQMLLSAFVTVLLFSAALAQTTTFTYQGKLNTSGNPATGNYDMQFKLFDALTDGNQIGAAITHPTVAVASGVFSVELDFGAGAFDGTPRFLEIGLRPMGNPDPYTVLAPRQPIIATPYSMRSANAATADGLSPACVGCVGDSHIETIDGAKITGTVAGSQISGEIPTASVPDGSGNYIQNAVTAQRLGKNSIQQEGGFNINGDGVAGGTLAGNVVEAATQFNLAGNRILSNPGTRNLFAGVQAGAVNLTGLDNSFFGTFAGQANLAGIANSFFGVSAGFNNLGNDNSFFGASAGFTNTTGNRNSYFGRQAGRDNADGRDNSFFGIAAGRSGFTGSNNSFFGAYTGEVNTGSYNSFFGNSAGWSNTLGGGNSFFGAEAGYRNTDAGDNNSFFGRGAGYANMGGDYNTVIGYGADVGSGYLSFATAIGAGAIVTDGAMVQIGRLGNDHVAIGSFSFTAPSSNHVCFNSSNILTTCSSSLRYKTAVHPFHAGLSVIQRLRPISFTWKESGLQDIGLGAEEVAEVDEQFIFRNPKGQIEGVKYAQLSILFINAFKEQQVQIQQQQQQIQQQQQELAAIKSLLCQSLPQAEFCKAKILK